MHGLVEVADVLHARGVPAEILDAATVRREEPYLSEAVAGGLLIGAHGYVAAGQLTHALAAAARLQRGRAIGVDVWRGVDQSGNGPEATRANADILGVADRVELHTADVRDLPLPDGCADVVVSSLVLHNLPDAQARSAALVRPFVCCGRVGASSCSTSPT